MFHKPSYHVCIGNLVHLSYFFPFYLWSGDRCAVHTSGFVFVQLGRCCKLLKFRCLQYFDFFSWYITRENGEVTLREGLVYIRKQLYTFQRREIVLSVGNFQTLLSFMSLVSAL